MEIIGNDDNSCVKINHNQMIGRGTKEYCLALRENLLENRNYRVPEDWDTTWDINLGPVWTPEDLSLKCWYQPEYFHPLSTTSSTTETSQPDESVAVDTMFHNGLTSTSFATNAQIQVGNQGGTRTRTAMVWDLTELPTTAVITSATLTLTEHTDGMDDEQTIRVQRITQTMTEAATWATYNGSNAWTSAGGDYSTDIISDTTTSGGDLTINNSKFVELCQDAIDNRNRYLRILIATVYELGGGNSGNQRMKYNSASDSTSGDRPKLVITYTDSGAEDKIYRAEDRLGSYNAEQNTDDNRIPTFSAALNGHKGIKFGGGTTLPDYLSIPDSSVGSDFDCGVAGAVPSSNLFCAVVVNAKGIVNGGGLFTIFSKGGECGIELGVDDSSDYKFVLKLAQQTHDHTAIESSDGLFIVCFGRSGTAVKIWVNGVEVSNATALSNNPNNDRDVLFGATEPSTDSRGSISYSAMSEFWDGILYEFMWAKAGMSDTERQEIEGYLAHKYGLTGKLESDHPYKDNPKRTDAPKEAIAASSINLKSKMDNRDAKTAAVTKNYTT